MSGVDRISQLPDEIIDHILSFLSTSKLRARTSLLSKRWRYIWTHHPSLDLPTSFTGNAAGSAASIQYAQAILGCLRSCNAAALHKISVDLWFPEPCTPDEAKLHAAAADLVFHFAGLHSVCELRIETLNHPSYDEGPMIPGSLFCCSSVADLRIHCGTFPNVPSDFHGFRYLISLFLDHVSIDNDTMEDLLVCCPLLEYLWVEGCHGLTYVDVSPWYLPNIMYLHLFDCGFLRRASIEAPNLISISYEGDLQFLNLKGSPFLIEAGLRWETTTNFDSQDNMMRLLFMISTVSVLAANDWFYQFVIPKPDVLINLKDLTLYIDELTESTVKVLIINIGECPMLERLDINFRYVPEDSLVSHRSPPFSKYSDALLKHLEDTREQDWCDLPELFEEPRCSLFHLKTVIMREFLDSKNQMYIAKFLLGNAVALEKFIVFDFLKRGEEELQKLFAPIPRASSQVQLKLSLSENSTLYDFPQRYYHIFCPLF